MNRFMDEKWSWIEGSHGMRDEVLDLLTDAELAYTPGGDNMPLGELFRQMGEVEHSYLHGLKTLTQNWQYRNTEAGIEGSVSRLTAWFHELDAELLGVVSAFTNEDLERVVLREESGYTMQVEMVLDVYIQALLIFFGKAVVYLKAMQKPLPHSVQEWIW
jgi:hypothetical protein